MSAYSIVQYWVYSALIAIVAFIPGFAIATRIKTLNITERFAVSFGFSFMVLILLVPFFASNLDFFAQLLFIGTMIVSLYLLKKRSELKLEIDARFLVLLFILGLISKFFLQTLWEYPVMGGDWFGHAFSLPYTFEQMNWTPPRDRTPLFSILIYSYHHILGTSLYQYWVSQIISVVVNSVYIFPAYLIAKKAFGDWVSRVSSLFMLVTPFLIFNTLYTWPKNAAMYGILMMIYFLFFSEHDTKLRYPLAGFFAGLGFWFHNYAIFYIVIAVLLIIYTEKMYKNNIFGNLKKISYFLFVLTIILTPYFVWVNSYYGTFSTSRFVYYPFAVSYDLAVEGTPNEILNSFYKTPINDIVGARIINAVVTLTPAALPINPIARSFHTYNSIFYYSHDYPGALSTLMYLVIVAWFLRFLYHKTKTNMVLVTFVVFPFGIGLILWGWKDWGLVNQILLPTVPVLIMIGINELNVIVNNIVKLFLVIAVFVGALIDGIIYAKLINTFYYYEGGLNQISESGLAVIPNFKIAEFISAYFLLNIQFEKTINLIISISSIIILILYIKNKCWGHSKT